MAKLLCDEVMTKEVASCHPGVSVQGAAQLMAELHAGSLPVVEADRRVAGVVSDRDLIQRVLAAGRDPAQTPVEDVMTARW